MEKVLNFAYVTPKWIDNKKGYEFHFESIRVKETEKQYKVIKTNPNLFLDLGSVIKKDELEHRAVSKACGFSEVGVTIVDGSLIDARMALVTKIGERISYIKGRMQSLAEKGRGESSHLTRQMEDCANQLIAIYA